jgi:hypothetical protein
MADFHKTITPDSQVVFAGPATQYSDGMDLEANPSTLGIILKVGIGIAGPLDVIVQTAPQGATAAADWVDTSTAQRYSTMGNYSLEVASPVLDAVRIKAVYAGAVAFNLDADWVADKALTAR